MNSRNSSLLCVALALLSLSSSAIEALDITKMLAKYPEFSSFNKYLTETKLADQINSRQTITILAVDDSSISSISGKSQAAIKAILSTHVVLDYFDEKKLMNAVENQQTQMTTLFQTTGPTNNQMGFIKVGLIGEGEMAFGSAVNGAPIDVQLVKTVVSEPYNISILQVVRPIIAPGIEGKSSPSPASSSTPKAKAPTAPETPASAKAPAAPVTPASAKAPAAPVTPASAKAPSSPSESEKPEAKAPAPSRKQIAPSSETTPSSEISPEAEISLSPLSDDAAAPSDAPVPASSSSSRIQMGLSWAAFMGFGALVTAM
ncbi:hypothetical protein K1719_022434 [Acacia pycnantha]|nr:hypothetical protein K1719_022434 [Acacia pycnantha]